MMLSSSWSQPSKVRFFHSENLGIDDGPAILHDVVFWKKIPSKEWTFLTSLDTLAFNRGALPHDFLGKHLAVDACPPHPFEWACSNNVRSFFLCWNEGRGPLEGPFVRDTSQDHKSSGKCPPGFPLTTSGILWYEPVLEIIVEIRISWFPSSSSWLVIVHHLPTLNTKVFIQEDEWISFDGRALWLGCPISRWQATLCFGLLACVLERLSIHSIRASESASLFSFSNSETRWKETFLLRARVRLVYSY